eukprot:SM000017S02769  [mRNA]  locus=s17:187280:188058:- [translate_table: standard]
MPLSKVRAIMRLDPDVRLVTVDAVAIVAAATELFLHALVSKAQAAAAAAGTPCLVRGLHAAEAARRHKRFRDCLGSALSRLPAALADGKENGGMAGGGGNSGKATAKGRPPQTAAGISTSAAEAAGVEARASKLKRKARPHPNLLPPPGTPALASYFQSTAA